MSFLQLPTEIHTSLLLEWLPFYKEYSALDVALSERRYWLELLRSPVLVVDPPLAIAPDRSYYTWLEGRQLKVATLRVDMAEMASIKTMRFPSVTKVVAVFSEELKKIKTLAHFFKGNPKMSQICTEAVGVLCMGDAHLLDLARHPLDLKVVNLLDTPMNTSSNTTARGFYALLYQFGHTLVELRLCFDQFGQYHDFLREFGADVMLAIGERCPQLRILQLANYNFPMKAILLLCEDSKSLVELSCCSFFHTNAEAASACQMILNRLPRLEHLSLLSSGSSAKSALPILTGNRCLQSIAVDEGFVCGGEVEISYGVIPARAHQILMTLPRTMHSIIYSQSSFSSSQVLQIAQKHGSQLKKMAFSFATMSANEWGELWAMCPNLQVVENANMTLDIAARCFERTDSSALGAKETVNILLSVPVALLTIRLGRRTNLDFLTSMDIFKIAVKHGVTLTKFDIRLHNKLGAEALTNFFKLCPMLQRVDLAWTMLLLLVICISLPSIACE